MTREEFDRHHAHNVFTLCEGHQCRVVGFDEEAQEIDIQCVSSDLRRTIPVTRYLYEAAIWPTD